MQFNLRQQTLNNNHRLNGQPQINGLQVPPVGLANSKHHQQQQQQQLQRFQVHPLQPIQRRDSNFAKVHTCFEATLTLLEPVESDVREYSLWVYNERGFQSGAVNLKLSVPLSPVLMISSAFLTICGLFSCSLVLLFIFKKRQHYLQTSSAHSNSNNNNNNSNGDNNANRNSQRSLHAKALAANGKQVSNGLQQLTTANGHEAQNGQQQHHQHGVVNGAGNGLANGASNPAGQLDSDTAKALHMMSMASSDTSCNDQKQLLANSDRNSSASGSSSAGNVTGGAGPGPRSGSSSADSSAQDHYLAHHQHHHSASLDRSTANSTPSQMNHISVDDELHLGTTGSYQAAESVTRGARLSPPGSSIGHHSAGASALIYANIDYTQAQQQHQHQLHSPGQSTLNMSHLQQHQQQQRPPLRRQHTPIASPTGSQDSTSINDSHHLQQARSPAANSLNSQTGNVRSSVGATIAMMNSLAAAAAAAAANQGSSSPGSGVLNGAINQQLANSRQLVRKPGPPKPPKPSIQQRSRFYQQQAAAASSGGLVMIGSHPQGADQQLPLGANSNTTANDLAVEYSRIAFPARAEL